MPYYSDFEKCGMAQKNKWLSLPYLTGVDTDHGLASFAAKGFLELRHILHNTIDTPVSGSV
jgi:hypothetical protein